VPKKLDRKRDVVEFVPVEPSQYWALISGCIHSLEEAEAKDALEEKSSVEVVV